MAFTTLNTLSSLPTKLRLPNFGLQARLWNFFVEGPAPDRRPYNGCYFPLMVKNRDGSLTYVGAFVPDLYEKARAENNPNAFEAAILLPKKNYVVTPKDKLTSEDLSRVGAQVGKALFAVTNELRNKKSNLNIYSVERMAARGLYFNDNSGVAQSVALAEPGKLINVYGGARQTTYHLSHIEVTKTEKLLHASLAWLGRTFAVIAAVGTGLAVASTAPYWAFLAAFSTYYILTSVKQFEFWDHAEALIKNSWIFSPEHAKPKAMDWVKLGKTLAIAVMVGVLAYWSGMSAYTGAIDLLTSMMVLTPKALLGAKIFAGSLGVTTVLGDFRGLMGVMHAWLGLGYAKTAVTAEEVNSLSIDKLLTKINDNNKKYKPGMKHKNDELEEQVELQSRITQLQAEIAQLKQDKEKLEVDLKKAQNPCASKVAVSMAEFKRLQENGAISPSLDFNNLEEYNKAYLILSKSVPTSRAAWASAQFFYEATSEAQRAAIDKVKQSNPRAQLNEQEFAAYIASPVFLVEREAIRQQLLDNGYKFTEAATNCCCGGDTTMTEGVFEKGVQPPPVRFSLSSSDALNSDITGIKVNQEQKTATTATTNKM